MTDGEAAVAAMQRGIDDGLHLGGQLCVSRGQRVVVDVAVGESRPGVAMTPRTIQPWFSATKPLVSVAVAQLLADGLIALDDAVATYLAGFGVNGKAGVTVRQLLTHTSGIEQLAPPVGFRTPWPDLIEMVCALPVEPGWDPSRMARYGPSGWFALAELVSTVRGTPFETVVARSIADPGGMTSTHLGLSQPHLDRWRDEGMLGASYDTTGHPPLEHPLFAEDQAVMAMNPAGGARGPARDLHALYRALLDDWLGGEPRLLPAPVIEIFAARHRVGIVDQFFGAAIEWGLGFIVSSSACRGVPYGYGPAASSLAFGHAGFQSSVGFADPTYDLAVGLIVNGTPGLDRHEQRFAEILAAVYADAGIVAEDH